MDRRTFLGTAAGLAGSERGFAASPIPVIDAHTHFFDPRRPEGVTWPTKDMSIYRPVLPDEFVKLTKPLNVKGTVVVEVGPRMEDHDWGLALAEKNPVIVGYVGCFAPGKPDFASLLERYGKKPLFRGIRTFFGVIADALAQPRLLADLKLMAAAGLEIDVAGSPRQLPRALVNLAKLSERIPDLRMVINHLPMPQPETQLDRALLTTGLSEMQHCPRIYTKLSEVIRRVGDRVPVDLSYWRGALDEVYDAFGPDRVVYGSNWPSCLAVAEYPPVFSLVQEYFAGKGRDISEKYFWRNSVAAYRWNRREKSQPDPEKAQNAHPGR